MSIKNKIAVITGASRGIGQAIALELGRRDAIVVATATSDNGASAISAYLAEAGVAGKGYKLDVSSDDSVSAFCEAVQADFGAAEILINNAGITRDNLMMRMKQDDWDTVLNTNLSSVFRVSKALLRGMTKARWGRIISISSVVGASGNMGQTNYSAAKSGIGGFTRSLAQEVGVRGITVNAVAPGFIDTDMTREISEEQSQAMLSRIPLGRYGNVDEIASVVGFLASEEAGYISGETINVNGGMYMA